MDFNSDSNLLGELEDFLESIPSNSSSISNNNGPVISGVNNPYNGSSANAASSFQGGPDSVGSNGGGTWQQQQQQSRLSGHKQGAMTAATKAALGEHLRNHLGAAEKRKMEDSPGMPGVIGGDDASFSPYPKAQKLDQDSQQLASLFGDDQAANSNNSPAAQGMAGGGFNDDFPSGGGDSNFDNDVGASKATGGLLAQALKAPSRSTTLNARSPPYNNGMFGGGGGGVAKQLQLDGARGVSGVSEDHKEQINKINQLVRNPAIDQQKKNEELSKIFHENPQVYRTLIRLKQRGQQQQQGKLTNGPMGGGFPNDANFDGGMPNNGMGIPQQQWMQQPPRMQQVGQPQRYMSPQQQQMARFPMQQQSPMFPGGGGSGGMDGGAAGGMWDPSFPQSQPMPAPRMRTMAPQQAAQHPPPPSYPYGPGGPRMRQVQVMQQQQQHNQMNQSYVLNEYSNMCNGYSPAMMSHGGPAPMGDFNNRGNFGAMPGGGMIDMPAASGGMYPAAPNRMVGGGMRMNNPSVGPMNQARLNQLQQSQQQSQLYQQQPFTSQEFLQQPNQSFPQRKDPMSGGGMIPPNAIADMQSNSPGGQQSMRGMQQQQQQGDFFANNSTRLGMQQQQQLDSWKLSPDTCEHRSQMKNRLQVAVMSIDETLGGEADRVEEVAFQRCGSVEAYNQEIATWLADLFQRGKHVCSSSDNGNVGGGSVSSSTGGGEQSLPQQLSDAANDALQAAEAAAENPSMGGGGSGGDFFSPSPQQPLSVKSHPSPSSATAAQRRSLSEQNPILSKLLPAASSPGGASAPGRADSLDIPDLGDDVVAPGSSLSADISSSCSAAEDPSSSSLSPSGAPSSSSPAPPSSSTSTTTASGSLKSTLSSSVSAPTPTDSFQSPPPSLGGLKGSSSSGSDDQSKSPSQLSRGVRRASGKGLPPSTQLQQQQQASNNNPYSVDSGFGSPRSNASASHCSPKINTGTSPSLVPVSESSPDK